MQNAPNWFNQHAHTYARVSDNNTAQYVYCLCQVKIHWILSLSFFLNQKKLFTCCRTTLTDVIEFELWQKQRKNLSVFYSRLKFTENYSNAIMFIAQLLKSNRRFKVCFNTHWQIYMFFQQNLNTTMLVNVQFKNTTTFI